MNIKINKKLVSLILAGTVLSLSGCATKEDINTDTISFNDVLVEVEDETVVDDLLSSTTFDRINPYTGEVIETMDMVSASKYLEKLLDINRKLNEIGGIKTITEDNEYYYMVEESVNLTTDDIYDFIDDIYYNTDEMQALARGRLAYYKAFLQDELRTNGVGIAICLLEDSIKGKTLDLFESSYSNADDVIITDNYVTYSDNKLLFDNDALELLDVLYNIRDNSEEAYEVMNDDIYSILQNSFNTSKETIFRDGVKIK